MDPSPEGAPRREQKRMGAGMLVLAWLLFGGLAVYWFDGMLERQRNPNQTLNSTVRDGFREVVLKRNRAGHYVTSGKINGQDVVFMLDTGATTVAIPGHIAAGLSLPRGQEFMTQTANGLARAYSTRLDVVSIGDIALSNVSAGVSPGLQTEEILLGMSFLQHIEFTQRGDTLILRQGTF
ncbi:MAG: TIGR02281 family clan AA aspartic protease [Halieaceae bacterium]|nr:TIGR02281 family clan AA aspartic protease [Halieaceae bacterium]